MPGPKEFSETYVTAETLDAECAKWMEEIPPYAKSSEADPHPSPTSTDASSPQPWIGF